jgi:hypothetical protein
MVYKPKQSHDPGAYSLKPTVMMETFCSAFLAVARNPAILNLLVSHRPLARLQSPKIF